MAAAGIVAALAVAGGAVALAVAAGSMQAPTVMATPSGTGTAEPVSESDFCFVESMIFYRVEALGLSEVLLDTDGITPAARDLASAAVAEQDAEIDELREWYVSWSAAKPLERPDEGPCAGHGAHADMPGVPTWSERTALAGAAGAEAEALYVELMLAAHAGVIDLAEETLAGDPHPLVRAAAEDAIAQGERETGALTALRGDAP